MSQQLRRTMPLLPISIVMQLTELTARQIRYYEDHDLINPARTDGNRRMFSLIDVDTLLEIKDFLEQGINMAGIKKIFEMKNQPLIAEKKAQMTDKELRSFLRVEMQQAGRMQKASLRQGDLSRFYH
ncbi:MerR family transcriptional regulator [Paenisporosarcina antarctica]|uniref:MerR family transcriptional regulator n=1 Tax=Paenisporosarcina antarctica TaxID=417367 RepID=A0A4P6ZYQ1_9BACL|nr:MerR family transcriptional regulator [Paenisporosarcina antarctica]QBP41404.1 MerR family transcriptional regulator [Paenisporosarcina antarctica]